MNLPIVQYGHPALRSKGKPIDKIDDRIRKLADDMIDTMNDADGVGLAAQQVGLALQICVVDVADAGDHAGTMLIDGQPADLDDYMPLVLINPEVEPFGDTVPATEGCLSFPALQGQIPRPGQARVTAKTLEDETLSFEADGLLARAIQHEKDHLEGVLYIDRMLDEDRQQLAPDLDKLMRQNAM
ncbi:MAG: peptide deformylase [Chthoniobacterales bacterium]